MSNIEYRTTQRIKTPYSPSSPIYGNEFIEFGEGFSNKLYFFSSGVSNEVNLYSEDNLITFTSAATPNFLEVSANNDIIVGYTRSSGFTELKYSYDAVSWTGSPTSFSGDQRITNIVYLDSLNSFFAGGYYPTLGVYSDVCFKSSDGITWSEISMPASASYRVAGVDNDNGYVFIYVTNPTEKFYRSSDLVNFTEIPITGSGSFYSFIIRNETLGKTMFWRTQNDDSYLLSDDSVNWTTYTTNLGGVTTDIKGVDYRPSDGRTLMVNTVLTSPGSNITYVSDDLINWTQSSVPLSDPVVVKYLTNRSQFIVLDRRGGYCLSNDGYTWTKYDPPFPGLDWLGNITIIEDTVQPPLPSPSPTPSATVTPTPSVTPTNTPTPSVTATPTPTPSAVVFTPADLTGLYDWWRADTGVDTTGSLVNAWTGHSGNVFTAASSQKAVFSGSSSDWNGEPCIILNTGQSYFGHYTVTPSSENTDKTLILVSKIREVVTTSANNPVIGIGTNSGLNPRWILFGRSSTGTYNGYANTIGENAFGSGFTNGNYQIVMMNYNRTTGEYNYYVSQNSDVFDGVSYSETGTSGLNHTVDLLALAWYPISGYNSMPEMSVVEVIATDSILSAAETTDLQNYLANRYGI